MTTTSAVHSQPPSSYECPGNCGQTFVYLDTFYKHWTQHKDQCPFPGCKTRSGSKFNFKRHWKREHGDYFPDHSSGEKTACRHNCGKLYSEADVSNLRRHEKTCRGSRTRIRPQTDSAIRVVLVDDDATSTTDQDLQHGETSGILQNLVQSSGGETFQHSPSPARRASIEAPQILGCWRDSRPIVEAVEKLEQVLVGGPAADAFHVFTSFLDKLGHSFQISNLSGPQDSNEVCERTLAGRTDQIVDLDDVQQGSYENDVPEVLDRATPDHTLAVSYLPPNPKRRIDTDEADISQSLPKRLQLWQSTMSMFQTRRSEAEARKAWRELRHRCVFVYDSVRSGTLIDVKTICLLWFGDHTALEQVNTPFMARLLHSRHPLIVPTTNFCKWALSILTSTQLHPNIIFLALLLVYRLVQLNSDVNGKPGSEYRILIVALMSAEKLYEDKPHTNRFWAEESGITLADINIMEMEFLSNIKYNLFVSIEQMSKWSERLVQLVEVP